MSKPKKSNDDQADSKSNSSSDSIVFDSHPTNFIETIIHLFKGNIGPGLFAMGDAFKNGGILVSPFVTVMIAIIAIHCQHVLLNCAEFVKDVNNANKRPDYAKTVELSFEVGSPNVRKWSKQMRKVVNLFICVTQLGFCCIYFVFISSNMEKILNHYGIYWSVHIIMLIAFVPILLTSLITNLKYLAPVSLVANVSMICALFVTLYFAFEGDIPSPTERHYYTNPSQMALYFGTVLFAFEGIALVLPLKNTMKIPSNFDKPIGVLNVGMTAVTFSFMFAGFFGYLKWGDEVGGSLSLNLGSSFLGQLVQIMVSLGVLLGYPLQFFIAIQIMLPSVKRSFKLRKDSLVGELTFRTIMVIITLTIAELVPKLSLFISLIGALCSTALALVFPSVIELVIKSRGQENIGKFILAKNIFIICFSILGFSTGTYESVSALVREFKKDIENW